MAVRTNRNLKRKNRIYFYLSDEELDEFNNRFSNYKSNNRSDFIRQSVLNDFIIINDDTNLRKLVYEINRIGNNINQLTRLANETKKIQGIKEMKSDIEEVKNKLHHSLMLHNKKR